MRKLAQKNGLDTCAIYAYNDCFYVVEYRFAIPLNLVFEYKLF